MPKPDLSKNLKACPKCKRKAMLAVDWSFISFEQINENKPIPLVCYGTHKGKFCNQQFDLYAGTGRITARHKEGLSNNRQASGQAKKESCKKPR